MEIEKTNRMNALFEFYASLLTDKQMNYIELYYADDYSLAEIAEEFGVSRQAVYDNINEQKRYWMTMRCSSICTLTTLFAVRFLIRSLSAIQKMLFSKSKLRF